MELKWDLEILPLGKEALLINFPQAIDPEVHQGVLNFSQSIRATQLKVVRYVQPAYCSIAVGYDARSITFLELKDLIVSMYGKLENDTESVNSRNWNIPVCYEQEYGLDLGFMSAKLKVTTSEIIRKHTSRSYRVYMLGFLPGFPYMGLVDPAIRMPRQDTPRREISAGSVGIAGSQTGIYPIHAPGGWSIIGRCPIPMWDDRRTTPFLFEIGDTVAFKIVEKEEFEDISNQISKEVFDLSALITWS